MTLSAVARRKLSTGIASTSEAAEICDAIDGTILSGLTAFTDTIAATASGTQGTSIALTSRVNRVSTVTSAGDGVKLPLAASGVSVVIINDTSNYMKVFGAGTDTINDAVSATGVIQGPYSAVTYHASTAAPAGKYYTGSIGVGFLDTTNGAASFPMPINHSVGGSTAAAGTNTGTATGLPAGTATVYPTTAADDTKGVVINAADQVTGRTLFIGNGVVNKILKVYPPSGGTINGAAGDAAFSSVSGKGVIVTCLSSAGNTWLAW